MPEHPSAPGSALQQPVLSEQRGAVRLVTLNRPTVLNAVNGALADGLAAALQDADSDPATRAVVITGAGRAFCAGADLKAVGRGERIVAAAHPEWDFAGMVRQPLSVPLIAAVNGDAFGGGLELVLACDLAIAEEQVRLGLPEVHHGLFPGSGGPIRLPVQVPPKIAAELALTGDPVTAEIALRWGLINSLAPTGEAVEAAMALAARVTRHPPGGTRASKRMLRRAVAEYSDWYDEVWRHNRDEIGRVLASADARAGLEAFKRRGTR